MNLPEVTPALRATAVAMLPGMKHARALLDVSIDVLEYFEKHAEEDARQAKATALPPPTSELQKEVDTARAMLSAFGRLHSA